MEQRREPGRAKKLRSSSAIVQALFWLRLDRPKPGAEKQHFVFAFFAPRML